MFVEQITGQNVKIKFDINEKQLLLGDILKITSSGKNGVLVQVVGVYTSEKNPNFNIAESKILFTIESTGKLMNWQGNIPSQDFVINKIQPEEVLLCSNTLNPLNPIPLGRLSLYPDTEIKIEASFLEKPTVIYCDKQSQKDNIFSLLACELSKNREKTVLIDFNGDYSDLKVSTVLEAGKNFKIPLDVNGLEYLYNNTLSGVSAETRAVIEDVFMEIEEYLSSGETEFIPFSSFLQAVISVYEQNKIAELVLLKNKLARIQKHGIFADKRLDFTAVSDNFYHNNLIIVDLSHIPAEWQKEFIKFIIDSNIKTDKQKYFMLFDSNKIKMEEAFVEKLCGKANKSGISPVIISGHDSETAVSLLSFAKNTIVFKPENTSRLTSLKDSFIRLNDNEAVITGIATNNIPLYVDIYSIEAFENNNYQENSNIIKPTQQEIYLSQETEEYISEEDTYLQEIQGFEQVESTVNYEEDNFNYSGQFDHNESEITLVSDISNLQEEVFVDEEVIDNFVTENQEDFNEEITSEESAVVYEEDNEETTYTDVSEDEDYDYEKSEITQESGDFSEASNDFYTDEDDFNYEQKESLGESEEELYGEETYEEETVNEPLYEMDESDYENAFLDEETEEDGVQNFSSSDSYYQSEDNSAAYDQGDDDFDYNSSEEFQDESLLDYASPQEEQTENHYQSAEKNDYGDEYDYNESDYFDDEPQSESSGNLTQDIPEYPAPSYEEEETSSNKNEFKEGDKVVHIKYGMGTVTKVIGYSNKKLCSIQFDEVGRRLLDPNLAELQKMN